MWLGSHTRALGPTLDFVLTLALGMLVPAAPSLLRSYGRYLKQWEKDHGPTRRRPLTDGELRVLRMIQEEHGLQNTEEDVFFTDRDEAAIFSKGRDGTRCLVLTNLAAFRAEGIIATDEALRREWLHRGPPRGERLT